jgi:hypothetical protein
MFNTKIIIIYDHTKKQFISKVLKQEPIAQIKKINQYQYVQSIRKFRSNCDNK